MAYEKVIRNRYHEPGASEDPKHTSANHSDDFQDFHIPLERMHNSNLHDWGIASGLEVSGVIDGTEIIVNPGVAIDSNGQLISLSNKGNISSSQGGNNEVNVPVNLNTVNYAGKTVYVTIQFSENLRAGGVTGKLEQVPWVRLQPVDTLSTPDKDSLIDGKTIVLAIAIMDNNGGKLAELKAKDNNLPFRRHLVGETIEELQIQKSIKVGDKVQDILSGKIGPGDSGGLKITVPETQDSIFFAREDGSEFSNLEVRANVGIGTTNPKNKLEISGGNIAISDNSHRAGKIRLWEESTNDDKNVSHAIGTEPYCNVYGAGVGYQGGIGHKFYRGGGELIAQLGYGGLGKPDGRLNSFFAGNVGIGIENPSEKLEVAGNIKIQPQQYGPDGHFELFPTLYESSIMAEAIEDSKTNALNFHVEVEWRSKSQPSRLPHDLPSRLPHDLYPLRRPPFENILDKKKPIVVSRSINVGDGWTFNGCQKNFLINHPLYPETHELVHSTLEGPECAVFYRGEAQLSNGEIVVILPDYFESLTRKENRTVLLTPKFEEEMEISMLAASEVKDGKFTVKMIDSKNPSQKFYWEVKAIRADVEKLEVEREKVSVK